MGDGVRFVACYSLFHISKSEEAMLFFPRFLEKPQPIPREPQLASSSLALKCVSVAGCETAEEESVGRDSLSPLSGQAWCRHQYCSSASTGRVRLSSNAPAE